MSRQFPPLTWIHAFEASARHLGFTAAARELNLTQAAVSHRVRSLERHVGFRMFERLPRGLRLTAMGRAYLPSVRKAFDDLSASTVGLFGSQQRTTVTVRAPVSFAVLWIAPRLRRFRDAYPDIDIRLFSTVWADHAPQDISDIDVRFGMGGWKGFREEPLFNDGARVVRRRDGGPLERETLIHVIGHEDLWRAVYREIGLTDREPPHSICVDTSLSALHMVAAGGGAAVVVDCFVQEAARSLPIETPFDLVLPLAQSHYLLTPEDAAPAKPEARLFRDWLMDETAGYRA